MKITYSVILLLCFMNTSVWAKWEKSSHQKQPVYTYYPEAEGTKSLMIVLHGCNQNSKFMAENGNWEGSADKHNMIVVSPDVLNGGVFFRCWNYFGKSHSNKRSTVKYLTALIEKYLNDPSLDIDKNKVFISGFSSGGGMSLIMSCLRPDLFAGVGAAAGPSLGTTVYESKFPSTNGKRTAKLCKKYAGDKAHLLKTMVSSFIGADVDQVVHAKYNKINAEMFNVLLGSELNKREMEIGDLENIVMEGKATVWDDGDTEKISYIVNYGIRHNWPAGKNRNIFEDEEGQNYSFTNDSLNFPRYMTDFLMKNNQRTSEFIFGGK